MGKHKRAGKGPDKGTPSTDKGKSKYRDIPKPEDVKTEFAGGATAKLIRGHYLHRAIDECECGHRGDTDEWAAHLASLLEGRQKESLNASWRNSLVRVWCVAHQEIEEVYRPVQGPIQGIVEDWHGKTRTGRE